MLSSAVITTEPAAEPITLAEAKAWLRIDGAGLDDQVKILIGAARADLEKATGQQLIEQEVTLQADSFADLEHLTVGPISDVVEIRYFDTAGDEKTVDPERFYLTGAGLERGIDPVPGYAWPRAQRRKGAIEIVLKVGYGATGADIPQNLRWALLALIRGKFEDRPVDIEPLIVDDRIFA